MAGFEHLLKSYDVRDQLDEIASADPPAYLRRCFAEGLSSPDLSFARVQQITVCTMVLDSIVNDRHYDSLEPELVADWRVHFGATCALLRSSALAAVRRALEQMADQDPGAAAELKELELRLAPG